MSLSVKNLQHWKHSQQNKCLLYCVQVFEYWLHPQRYRTQMCRDGATCSRKVCFFAHSEQQLRHVPGTPADAADPFSKAAKFSLSGMKRQKSSNSSNHISPTAASRRNSLDASGLNPSRLLFQPGCQAYDPSNGLAPCYSLESLRSSNRYSADAVLYPSNMLRNSSIDRASSSRKSSMDEFTGAAFLSSRRSLDLTAGQPPLPPQLRAPLGPLPAQAVIFTTGAPGSPNTGVAAVQPGQWVAQGAALPAATVSPAGVPACLGLSAAGAYSNTAADSSAFLNVLSAYQHEAETCRLQAAMAEAAATAAAGKLQALVTALGGLPDSGMLAQPGSLAGGMSSGLAPTSLELSGLDVAGLTAASLEPSGLNMAALTAGMCSLGGVPSSALAVPSSLALSGLQPTADQTVQGQVQCADQSRSLLLPGVTSHDLLTAAAAAAQAGMPAATNTTNILVGQLHTALLS